MNQLRRESPRIDVETMCWEVVNGQAGGSSGIAMDLSSMGLRIERPYLGGLTRREVQLEIEVPGIDEIMWAKGDACFDVIVPSSTPAGGPLGLIRRTGYRLVLAATRDLRTLREFVFDTDRTRRREELARCYDRA
ncbi:MAG: hypothetical protein JWP01_2448 [Myxococcales bacterium]|nr:hypothetical protein [Myxococcales bacterium]